MSGVILVFLVLFVLQAATGYWWWVLVVPFLCGAFRSRSSGACVRSSALGAGLLWMIGGVFALLTDSYLIAVKVAAMGGIGSPLIMVVFTAFLAALAGGFAGLTGFQLKSMLRLKRRPEAVQPEPTPGGTRHDDERRRTSSQDLEDREPPASGRGGT